MHYPHANQFCVLTRTAGPAGTPLQGCRHPPRPGFARVALSAQRCPCRWLAVAWMRLAQKENEKPH